ncbi:hypothetical protein GCM10022408_03060 [Hymenobacter fastidiosus]|uniref:Uncharacterized protein n=1 Tax=Hymenobacter fastidiosus TaxID=486264 RepID=A0ABP7RDE3_9BACT
MEVVVAELIGGTDIVGFEQAGGGPGQQLAGFVVGHAAGQGQVARRGRAVSMASNGYISPPLRIRRTGQQASHERNHAPAAASPGGRTEKDTHEKKKEPRGEVALRLTGDGWPRRLARTSGNPPCHEGLRPRGPAAGPLAPGNDGQRHRPGDNQRHEHCPASGLGYRYGSGPQSGHVVELVNVAVLVPGRQQRLTLADGRGYLRGLFPGVLVGVQRQQPCLRCQHPPKEQEQQHRELQTEGRRAEHGQGESDENPRILRKVRSGDW